MAVCPFPHCGRQAATWHGLKKHLMGNASYGGHGISEMEAEDIAKQVFAGTYRAKATRPSAPMAAQRAPVQSAEVLADPYASFLIRLLETMVEDKALPKYQFERRVDTIISLFLPSILKKMYGWRTVAVVPEFPLKKANNNQTTNADHLLFRHRDDFHGTADAWVMFELKTDTASCSDEQLSIYLSALDRGMPQLLRDLDVIAEASTARQKYAALRDRMLRYPADRPIELLYLAPCRISATDPRVRSVTFKDLEKLQLDDFPEAWKLFRSIVAESM